MNTRLSDYLARRLAESGMTSRAEQLVHNRRVDIVVRKPDAHKIFLEAKRTTLAKAKERARQHFSFLPAHLRPDFVGAIRYSAAFSGMDAAEKGEPLEFTLLDKDSGEWTPSREITAAELARILAAPQTLANSENEVADAIAAVGDALDKFADKMRGREPQFAEVLKIELPSAKEVGGDPKKHKAHVKALDEAMHVAGLVIVNAMMFSSALNNQALATKDGGVYVSILAPARRLIEAGECEQDSLSILKRAADKIRPLAERGVDILGRVFHTVLAHAKTYAAFFTGIPGATLMTEITLNPDRWENVDWGEPESIGKLRVCDPACGSGTLIGLAAWKLRRNFRFRVNENRADKLQDLHRRLVEDVIYAADIIPAAAHLAATSVALISPEASFGRSNVFCAPMGVFGDPPKTPKDPDKRIKALGSLAHLAGESWLLEKDRLDNLGIEVEGESARPFPQMDACLMNPPFVGGHKDRELFKFAGDARQGLLRKALRELGNKKDFGAGYGQGPAFLTLAADKIKSGGRLALILPAALATGGGGAWRKCRKVIEGRFNIEALIVSKDPERIAFSDSTDFSELMLIARQNVGREIEREALFVVLHKNHCAPHARGGSNEKAVEVAEAINEAIMTKSRRGEVPGGTYARMDYRGLPAWTGVNFVDMKLSAEVARFGRSGVFGGASLPVVKLEKVANFGGGRLHKYINEEGRFVIVKRAGANTYPGYYPGELRRQGGRANRDNFALIEDPHIHMRPAPGNEDWARNLYKSAGRIVLNESFSFNTTRRLAALVKEPVQCAHYHPISLKEGDTAENRKAMTLWLNCALVLAHVALNSIPTGLSWVSFPAEALCHVPALDFKRMDKSAIKKLARSFDAFVKDDEELAGFPAMEHDPARERLDNAVADALEIPREAFADLRARLAREPVISNRSYNSPEDKGGLASARKSARKSRKK